MNNPLKIVILELLNELTLPISEYQLIQHIKQKLDPFPTLSKNDSVALFQINFLVMNALYQLQQALTHEQIYLVISPLGIEFQPLHQQEGNERAISLHVDSRLSEYYLDWSHFENTGEQEVEALLKQFWTHFSHTDRAEKAYQTLAISPQSSWPEIKSAYRQQALVHHPDKGGQPSQFIEIRQAYEVLKALHP
ncbi:MAG: molecular chaperone DnaJ [Gammaproteobacteria bacterium]|nr:MAG: molecular chaperone DnaJ [Gammaproteobacteria bacterium]